MKHRNSSYSPDGEEVPVKIVKFMRHELVVRMDGVVLQVVSIPEDDKKRPAQVAWLFNGLDEMVGAIVKVSAVNKDEAVELALVAMFGRKTR